MIFNYLVTFIYEFHGTENLLQITKGFELSRFDCTSVEFVIPTFYWLNIHYTCSKMINSASLSMLLKSKILLVFSDSKLLYLIP